MDTRWSNNRWGAGEPWDGSQWDYSGAVLVEYSLVLGTDNLVLGADNLILEIPEV